MTLLIPRRWEAKEYLSEHLELNRKDLHLIVCDSHERIDGPSDKGESHWGQPCHKLVKSDDITNFITLRSKELEKAVEGRQQEQESSLLHFDYLINILANFHILFSFFLYSEDKKTFCNIRSCSCQNIETSVIDLESNDM